MAHACPEWEYEKYPGYRQLLEPRVRKLETIILAPGFDTLKAIQDTRATHRVFFKNLTPPLNPSFAGGYRGSASDKCLRHYRVIVAADPRVGTPPDLVAGEMEQLSALMAAMLPALDAAMPGLAAADQLTTVVVAGCQLLETFLRIHPYVNGNGHIGRFILWAVFARYGFRFRHTFQIEPKPPFMDQYSSRLSLYRDGDRDPLHKFIVRCVVPRAS